jgi:hypothetical protein
MIHLYAGGHQDLFNAVTPFYVKNSQALLPTVIRSLCTPEEIDPFHTTKDACLHAQAIEKAWHGNCIATEFEEVPKQFIYAQHMGLNPQPQHNGDFALQVNGESILDIGGGPSSMLLRTQGFSKATVVDPCNYPRWTLERYKDCGISLWKIKGEVVQDTVLPLFDEVWMYNTLSHCENIEAVIASALAKGKIIRVFEWLNTPTNGAHLHTLTKDYLDILFKGIGKVETLTGERGCVGTAYHGIFKGEKYGN